MSDNGTVISVIIPCYNGATKIVKCLNQLDKQSFRQEYEVIIVDDASPDGSAETIENYITGLEHSFRFHVIRCKENGRAGRARNIGVDQSKGEYVLFIDQDDYPDREMLRTLYDLTENGRYDCSACDVIDKNGTEYHRYPCANKAYLSPEERIKIMERFGYVFAILIRKSILTENKLRFPENVMFEDTLYNFGWESCISSINTTNKTLYYREDDENSQTASLNIRKLKNRVEATEMYLEMYRFNDKVQEYIDIINQFAFYYIYISCIWWMNTGTFEYDKDFYNMCFTRGHQIKIKWKEILVTFKNFGLKKLWVLRTIYYMPWIAHILRVLMRAKRLIKGACL